MPKTRRNPRFVGQVFRLELQMGAVKDSVVIPDLWGKSSDKEAALRAFAATVVIPDLWGKSSDKYGIEKFKEIPSRNPRFVGQVFRRSLSSNTGRCACRNPRFVGQVFRLRLVKKP